MNWKLVLQLSGFGFAMAFATVFVISSSIEPLFWLGIFLYCAYAIAKRAPGKPFVHGLCLGLVNSVWMTAGHVILFDSYVARHANELAMMQNSPISPRLMMLVVGPGVGLISGIVIGLFALVAWAIMGRSKQSAAASA
jgi:hypothetical protein